MSFLFEIKILLITVVSHDMPFLKSITVRKVVFSVFLRPLIC